MFCPDSVAAQASPTVDMSEPRVYTHAQEGSRTHVKDPAVHVTSGFCGLQKHVKTQHAFKSGRIISLLIVATRKCVKLSPFLMENSAV